MVYSTLFGRGVLEGAHSLHIDPLDSSLVRVQRTLPNTELICGDASQGLPPELQSVALFIEEAGGWRSDLFEWQTIDYMTGCSTLSVNVSADTDVDVDSLALLFDSPPVVQAWGDMTLIPQPRAYGTALLRATVSALRIPARIPSYLGAIGQVVADTLKQGDYALFMASVARVNQRPTMRVQDVSVIVTFAPAVVRAASMSDGNPSAHQQHEQHQEQQIERIFGLDLSAGAADEDSGQDFQSLSVSLLRMLNPTLFARPPTLSVVPAHDGGGRVANMSLVPAEGQLGESKLVVVLRDSGGRMRTNAGRAVGYDTSFEYHLTVTFEAGYMAPVFRFRPSMQSSPIVLQEGPYPFSKVRSVYACVLVSAQRTSVYMNVKMHEMKVPHDIVCCSVLLCAAVCCSVLQCVAACRDVLQCVAVCCSVM